jgi:hypothetical protein
MYLRFISESEIHYGIERLWNLAYGLYQEKEYDIL